MFIQPDNATFAALAALIDEVSSEESELRIIHVVCVRACALVSMCGWVGGRVGWCGGVGVGVGVGVGGYGWVCVCALTN